MNKEQTSCEALERFIGDLLRESSRYSKKRNRAYVYWISAQAIALLSGFLGAIVSVALTHDSPLTRVVTATLSALASFAGTVIVQLRLHELWRLREDIEPRYQKFIEEGRRQQAACNTDKRCSEVHKKLLQQRTALIQEERNRWFAAKQRTSMFAVARRRSRAPEHQPEELDEDSGE
jgi:hypothetical protein